MLKTQRDKKRVLTFCCLCVKLKQGENMEKIYGVYNGGIDVSALDNIHEIDVWKKIENIGGTIYWLNHDAADGSITLSKKDIEQLNEWQ